MARLRSTLLAALLLPGVPLLAAAPAAPPAASPAPAPAPAKDVLSRAIAAARTSGKGVLVGFHASWCGYCRKLEGTLADPAVKKVLDRRFVTTWLTILERPASQALENPGGRELFAEWSGGQTGIPFLATLDSQGRLVSTSLRTAKDGEVFNIGLPAREPEVDHFVSMLRDASPSMTDAEADVVRRAFL